MRNIFYLTMLISAILLGISALVSCKRYNKIKGYIFNVLAVITIVSFIGFSITLM